MPAPYDRLISYKHGILPGRKEGARLVEKKNDHDAQGNVTED
jgi:hypothetical protein